ncbi:helix-turn-helix domain-containing protein [Sphingomonas cavernae]|uniref:Helix-turn-helix domain-containing protein n=1 Tax=Sphingomonas cavernae TaxID=2320861 RepID=A0A418WRN7_9SPHN|nr:helix-turn-helix domain-containing protein [Sphingomonas cavernae]RJF93930.1 helix-turn-helix domain-containing protein [Sphingomonas cavernae]
MTDQTEAEGAYASSKKVGERLAEARKAAGLDLADIATRTRIPQRHLEAIEEGRYNDLPAITYCSGFTKAYARALGLDEVAFGRDVRVELEDYRGITHEPQYFEAADPARVPTRALAWTAALLALLVIGGFVIFRGGLLDGLGGRDPASVAAGTETLEAEGNEALVATNGAAPAAPTAAPVATGAVVLTATQDVWLRIYEAGGKRLFEKTMVTGETYQVPEDATNPQILTGRPDALRVTVGGREVAPLGPPEKTIADVGVSAAALAARAAAAAPTTPAAPGTAPMGTPSASNAQTPPGAARP